MLTHNTLDTLRHLKLTGMGDALEQQRAQPETHDLAFEERLALLVDREVLHRENRRLEQRLDPPVPEPVHHRAYRLRQDLAGLCPGQSGLPARPLGALPASAAPVRAGAHRAR